MDSPPLGSLLQRKERFMFTLRVHGESQRLWHHCRATVNISFTQQSMAGGWYLLWVLKSLTTQINIMGTALSRRQSCTHYQPADTIFKGSQNP